MLLCNCFFLGKEDKPLIKDDGGDRFSPLACRIHNNVL